MPSACVTHVNLVNEPRSYAQATLDCRASIGSRELFTMSAANVVCQSLVSKLTCKTNHASQRPRHVSTVLGIDCAVQACAFAPSATFRNGARTMCLPYPNTCLGYFVKGFDQPLQHLQDVEHKVRPAELV